MNEAVLYARFSPRPMVCPKCDKRMNKMRGLDSYECPVCEYTTTMDDEQGSLQAQLDYCREHCNRQGYEVRSKHHDSAMSGGNLDRPGLEAAIDALQRGDVLVVHTMDRLSRGDSEQWVHIEKRIRDKGARFESASGEGTWTNTPIDKLTRVVIRGVADYIRETGNHRTSDIMQAYQKDGRRMTNADRVPFGMMVDDNDPKRLIENPAEQEVIETILRVFAEVLLEKHRGAGYRETTRRIEKLGITSRSGTALGHTLVMDVIKKYAAG